MRLIDADALKENVFFHEVDNESYVEEKDIDNTPTVGAVSVVRCKDCKYFELNHWDGLIITAHEICNKWADGCKTNKDGYCFLGERKTDG